MWIAPEICYSGTKVVNLLTVTEVVNWTLHGKNNRVTSGLLHINYAVWGFII